MSNENWKQSSINLDLYLNKEDLELMRDKKNRKDKNSKNNIRERNLELVIKAKNGDIEARNTLFLLNTPIIRYTINKKFLIHPSEFDDIMSDSFFMFLKAVDNFNPTKSNNFVSLLQRCIVNELINNYHFDKRHNLDTVEYDETCDKEYEDDNNLLSNDINLLKIEYS